MSLTSRITSIFPVRFVQTWRGLRRVETGAAAGAAALAARPAIAPGRQPPVGPAGPLDGRTFDQEMAVVGGFGVWWQCRRQSRRQYVEAALGSLHSLRETAPASAREAIAVAAAVRRHVFDVLGSGPFQPVDPGRPARPDGYQPIDWYLDPVRGLRFPQGIAHRDWNLFEMRPANADIKYPWELGRCQHLLALGQAHLLARAGGDVAGGQEEAEAFAIEILAQCEDFIEANPIGVGVNWTCTMDVALRAASWCLSLALVKECEALPSVRLEKVYRHLYETGLFIVGNLENQYEVTSNHFLSNIVGLHILAGEFVDLELGRAWDNYARRCLEEEILAQVLEDGADYESSIPYHRLVTELFLGSWRLAQVQGRPLGDGYRARLVRMVDFLAGTLRPDGRMPVVGDADDGRLMIATGYGRWDPRDGRHILGPAAFTLGQPRWLAWAGEADNATEWQDAVWEAFWWGIAPDELISARTAAPAVPETGARLFPEAGIVVSRSSGAAASYLLVSNAIVGTKGFGNHKHNDLLSFEYFDRGEAVIVDPGSYVYTSDFDARNLFRSTAWHNTVVIDGIEQNEFRPEWLFRMFEKARPKHVAFEASDADRMIYEGSHDGYATQLKEGVTHTRRFVHERVTGRLAIEDRLEGRGGHDAVWHFHFAPEVEVMIGEDGRALRLMAGDLAWRLAWDDPVLAAELIESWISPSYGLRQPSRALRLARQIVLPGPLSVAFELTRLES